MSFRFLNLFLFAAGAMLAANQPVLRVCADPNNLPFSNQQGQGFENKLAEMLAAQLGARLKYTWWAERQSFLKNSLEAGRCDLVMGLPASLPSVATTRPYYQSTYVFVSRHDRNLHVTSLGDPRFSEWRVGVHVVGDDYAPPAAALARRGITRNIIGFSLFGSHGAVSPASKVIDAVANGQIDVAIVWGPFAGYFAKQQKTALDIVPVSPAKFLAIPFTYEIAAGVRKGDSVLLARIDEALADNSAGIRQILDRYGVPQVKEE
jgi:quinoprotein dehydrogenase-associated probable ABC transporter substrate-binding protein